MAENIDSLKEQEKFVEDTSSEARVSRGRSNGAGGLILIGIGVILLIANLTSFHLHNWWALFILIPAIGSLNGAWRHYQRHGRFTRASSGPLIMGLILALVATIFLLDLNWGVMWPVFLIIGGVGALLSGLFDQ